MENLVNNGLEVGDADIVRTNTLPDNMQEFMSKVDHLLPDGFDLYELEGDASVYFSLEEFGELATAEIRPTTPREKGYTEGGPDVWLKITSDGDTPDVSTTYFSIDEAVKYAVKRLTEICNN